MKQRFVTLSIVLTLVLSTLLLVSGCGKKGVTGKADLLSMLPEDASGIITINFGKFAGLEFFDKIIKKSEEEKAEKKPGEIFENYRDFVDKTGIDPKKDIFAVAVALVGPVTGPGEPDIVAVANLNYDKEKILALVKEKGGEITEETYKDVQGFTFKGEKEKNMMFAFISGNVAVFGVPDGVKKVIDLSKGEGKSVLDNEKLKPYIKKMNAGAIFSLVVGLPEDVKKVHDLGMFKMDLTKAEAVIGFADYADKAWITEIQLISLNEEGNQQLVSTLNGLKMMAGAAGPDVAELVEKINLSASADSVKMEITITDELMDKLQEKMKGEKKAAPAETEPQPEPPEGKE